MNDIIEVTGYKWRTPLIRFVQKGKGITNITGEKLSEQQLMAAVKNVYQQLNMDITFYLALACVEQFCYKLYIELDRELQIDLMQIAQTIDTQIRECNLEYDSKRASGRLGRLEIGLLKPGTAEHYQAHCLAQGQRESQFKPLLLQYRTDCDFPFDRYSLQSTGSE